MTLFNHKKRISTLFVFSVLLLFSFNITGCVDITPYGLAPLDKTIQVDQVRYPTPGHAYTMRGWLGIFSLGMNGLANRIEKEVGMRAMATSYLEWKRLGAFIIKQRKMKRMQGPIILIGHSYGADDVIKTAWMLNHAHIRVDLLIPIDPVTPYKIPPNVLHCVNIYKSMPVVDTLPWLRGVAVKAVNSHKTKLQNLDIRTAKLPFNTFFTNHISIDKNKDIQNLIITEIRKTGHS